MIVERVAGVVEVVVLLVAPAVAPAVTPAVTPAVVVATRVSSMQKFAREKGDLDVVFGFTAKEQSITMSSNMGVKHLIIYDAKSEDGTLSRSFVDFLNRVPDCLSSSLRNDPIMIKLKVLERGVTVA